MTENIKTDIWNKWWIGEYVFQSLHDGVCLAAAFLITLSYSFSSQYSPWSSFQHHMSLINTDTKGHCWLYSHGCTYMMWLWTKNWGHAQQRKLMNASFTQKHERFSVELSGVLTPNTGLLYVSGSEAIVCHSWLNPILWYSIITS